jgi:hypothetical protein
MSDNAEAGSDRLEIDNMYLCGSRFTRVSLKDAFFGDSAPDRGGAERRERHGVSRSRT